MPSVRSHLALLVAACVVPAALVSSMTIARAYRQGTDALAAHALTTARTAMQRVDAQLASAINVLQALATSPHFAARDYAGFDAQARAVLPYQPGDNIVLVEAGGPQVVNTRVPYGAPLPSASPAVAGRVFETGRPVVSDLIPGSLTGQPLVALGVPVSQGGRVTHSLAIGITPERLARLLPSPPSADWVLAVFDSQGQIVARNRAPDRLVGKPGAAGVPHALQRQDEGVLETDSVEGEPMLIAYSRSPSTGWAAAVGIPKQTLHAALLRWLAWLMVAGAAMVVLGLLAAARIGRGIAAACRGLVAGAQALGRGEIVSMPALQLREADSVAAAIAAASRLLHARTRERDDARHRSAQLHEAAHRDPLTGLANRSTFLVELGRRLDTRRRDGGSLSVLYVDLDDFKPINDRHGHAVGDEVLHAFATRLRGGIREGDLAARLGGDEFVVLMDGLPAAAAAPVAQALVERLAQPYAIGDLVLHVSASVGIAGYPADGSDVPALLTSADQAMYRAKAAGKAAFQLAPSAARSHLACGGAPSLPT